MRLSGTSRVARGAAASVHVAQVEDKLHQKKKKKKKKKLKTCSMPPCPPHKRLLCSRSHVRRKSLGDDQSCCKIPQNSAAQCRCRNEQEATHTKLWWPSKSMHAVMRRGRTPCSTTPHYFTQPAGHQTHHFVAPGPLGHSSQVAAQCSTVHSGVQPAHGLPKKKKNGFSLGCCQSTG